MPEYQNENKWFGGGLGGDPFAKQLAEEKSMRDRHLQAQIEAGAVTAGEYVPTTPEAEYTVVVKHAAGAVNAVSCTNAEAMQKYVERIRKNPAITEVSIYKRMLRYKTKVEWEAIDADV